MLVRYYVGIRVQDHGVTLTELMRADFDDDGLEEILITVHYYIKFATFRLLSIGAVLIGEGRVPTKLGITPLEMASKAFQSDTDASEAKHIDSPRKSAPSSARPRRQICFGTRPLLGHEQPGKGPDRIRVFARAGTGAPTRGISRRLGRSCAYLVGLAAAQVKVLGQI